MLLTAGCHASTHHRVLQPQPSPSAPSAAPTPTPATTTAPTRSPSPRPAAPRPRVVTTPSPSPRARPATTPHAVGRYVFPVQGCSVSYGHSHHDYPATDIFAARGCKVVSPVT